MTRAEMNQGVPEKQVPRADPGSAVRDLAPSVLRCVFMATFVSVGASGCAGRTEISVPPQQVPSEPPAHSPSAREDVENAKPAAMVPSENDDASQESASTPEPQPPRYDAEEEARVRKQLSAVAFVSQRLMSKPPARLALARRLFDETRARLRSGEWREEQRLGCMDSDGFWNAIGITTDDAGRIRVYTVLYGSGDSAGEIRYWFDEQERERMMIYARRDVLGGDQEHIVLLDAEGRIAGCDRRIVRIGDVAMDLCSDDGSGPPPIDAAVREATEPSRASRPKRSPNNELRDRLLEVTPRADWDACLKWQR